VTPKQAQEVIDRAWEAGYFSGPWKREAYESYGRPAIAARKAFQDLVGIWPDETVVDWYREEALPQLKLGRHGRLPRRPGGSVEDLDDPMERLPSRGRRPGRRLGGRLTVDELTADRPPYEGGAFDEEVRGRSEGGDGPAKVAESIIGRSLVEGEEFTIRRDGKVWSATARQRDLFPVRRNENNLER
jgi:hypothetical protein